MCSEGAGEEQEVKLIRDVCEIKAYRSLAASELVAAVGKRSYRGRVTLVYNSLCSHAFMRLTCHIAIEIRSPCIGTLDSHRTNTVAYLGSVSDRVVCHREACRLHKLHLSVVKFAARVNPYCHASHVCL